MKILNPKTGQVEDTARFASGVVYEKVCRDCKMSVGGCIVGGDSPYKTPPEYPWPCPFCKVGTVEVNPVVEA